MLTLFGWLLIVVGFFGARATVLTGHKSQVIAGGRLVIAATDHNTSFVVCCAIGVLGGVIVCRRSLFK